MTYLATGGATAKIDGDKIIVSIPTGNTVLEIAMTYGEAQRLGQFTVITATDAIQAANRAEPTTAQIIAFPSVLPSLAARERAVERLERISRVAKIVARGYSHTGEAS